MESSQISPRFAGGGYIVAGPEQGDQAMSDEPRSASDRELATKIAAAFVRRNQIPPDQLASLISIVYQALAGLGKPATEAASSARIPAVTIRRSIHRDYVVCLDCGWRGQMLRRHLTTAHGLSVDAYRARWKLPADHAMTAPAYSERRSTMAKQLGLGRGGRRTSGEGSEPVTPGSPAAAAPRRRGRPRTRGS
jgi:predicted transcriptional regulator